MLPIPEPITCITNTLDDMRSCTLCDEHLDTCDGRVYQWVPSHNAYEATGGTCRGCVPRQAEHGLLCPGCWHGLISALDAYGDLAPILEQFDRLVQNAGGGGATQPTVPLAPTKLALDEMQSYIRSMGRTIPEVWVASAQGAADAVHFAMSVRGALSAFPVREKATTIPRTRCPECQMLVLQWIPPELAGDPVRILCRNPACRYELDQDQLTAGQHAHLVAHPVDVALGEWLQEAAARGAKVVSVCGHQWTPQPKAPNYPPCPACRQIANTQPTGAA